MSLTQRIKNVLVLFMDRMKDSILKTRTIENDIIVWFTHTKPSFSSGKPPLKNQEGSVPTGPPWSVPDIVTGLLSFIFGNAYLKFHIHRIYTRSLRYSNTYSFHKTSKKEIQYLRSKNTYLKTLCIQVHFYCSMFLLTHVIML